jgi:pilus assembly protein Flp/PilA
MSGDAGGMIRRRRMKLFKALLSNESGATAIEYALIAGSISIAIVVAATTIGSSLNTTFGNVSNGLK